MEPNLSGEPYVSQSDSEVFGFPIARANAPEPDSIARAEEFCRSKGVKLLIVRCPVSTLNVAHALTKSGYLLMDTLVHFSCSVKTAWKIAPKSQISVRAARPEDEPTVIKLARESFNGYLSHYRADPRLDPGKCDEIYAYWVSSACRSQAENQRVLVAEEDENVVGFGIAKVDSEGMGEAVLAGVSPSFGRAGLFVYRALLAEGTRFALEKGATRAITSTQIHNVLIQRIWTEAGWVPAFSLYTFHKWMDD